MIATTQTLEGVTSKCLDEPPELHLHYIFMDLDSSSLAEAAQKLSILQYEFGLGDIFICSDKEGSYRAFCWSKRPWTTYQHILIHALEAGLLDFGFWVWTTRRGAATLRISDKVGRPRQECVAFLEGYEPTSLPHKVIHVRYSTGTEKKGCVIELGRIS